MHEIHLKQCTTCKEWKLATNEYFSARKDREGQLYTECRTCRNRKKFIKRHGEAAYEEFLHLQQETIELTHHGLKRCSRCKRVKPRDLFYVNPRNKDGLLAWCKECEAKARNRPYSPREQLPDGYKRCTKCEQVLPATSEHFHVQQNGLYGLRGDCKACNRTRSLRYWLANREHYRLKTQRRFAENPEQLRDIGRRWRAKHPDRQKESTRRWQKNNPGNLKVNAHRRRSRERSLPTTLSAQDWQCALDYFGGCCAVCGRAPDDKATLAADHWIPLSSPNCPGTIPTNIIPLCHGTGGCNNSKWNRPAAEWLQWKFGADRAAVILARVEAYFAWVRAQDGAAYAAPPP